LARSPLFVLYIYHFFVDGGQYENDQDRSSTFGGEAVLRAASAALLFIGFSLLLIQIAVGFRRFSEGLMPLGVNCSAAISAACHLHPLDMDAASRLVMWGVVDTWSKRASPETGAADQAQHLTFSSMHVTSPVQGFCTRELGGGGGTRKAVKSSITH